MLLRRDLWRSDLLLRAGLSPLLVQLRLLVPGEKMKQRGQGENGQRGRPGYGCCAAPERVPRGHLWSVSQPCKHRSCYFGYWGITDCDRWERCPGTSDVSFPILNHSGYFGPQGSCSNDGFCKAGITIEFDFWERFQPRKACENQRYTINSRVLFGFVCTAVILQVVVVWFFQNHDLLCSAIPGRLKRHYLSLWTLSFPSSVHYLGCKEMPQGSSGTGQSENRSGTSQEAPTATERYRSRLNWLEMNALSGHY